VPMADAPIATIQLACVTKDRDDRSAAVTKPFESSYRRQR
jgi:hypothetical protein